MELITAYLFCSIISISTISLIWVHRQQFREILENDAPSEEENLSSHDSFDSITDSKTVHALKTQTCTKRNKTPIAFKEELEREENAEREEIAERERKRKKELYKLWNISYS